MSFQDHASLSYSSPRKLQAEKPSWGASLLTLHSAELPQWSRLSLGRPLTCCELFFVGEAIKHHWLDPNMALIHEAPPAKSLRRELHCKVSQLVIPILTLQMKNRNSSWQREVLVSILCLKAFQQCKKRLCSNPIKLLPSLSRTQQ